VEVLAYETHLRQDRLWARKEIDSHFMRKGSVYKALGDLIERLESAGISYALIGALALGEHGLDRSTEDVDILVTKEGLAEFRARFEGLGYVPAFQGAIKKFRSTDTGVRIDFITTGEYPGDGKPKSVVFPDPREASVEISGLRVIALERFIELKLASAMTGIGREHDFGDIQKLIRERQLPEGLAEHLDQSVRAEYRRLWRNAQVRDPLDEQPL
jgi:hypothetical protein